MTELWPIISHVDAQLMQRTLSLLFLKRDGKSDQENSKQPKEEPTIKKELYDHEKQHDIALDLLKMLGEINQIQALLQDSFPPGKIRSLLDELVRQVFDPCTTNIAKLLTFCNEIKGFATPESAPLFPAPDASSECASAVASHKAIAATNLQSIISTLNGLTKGKESGEDITFKVETIEQLSSSLSFTLNSIQFVEQYEKITTLPESPKVVSSIQNGDTDSPTTDVPTIQMNAQPPEPQKPDELKRGSEGQKPAQSPSRRRSKLTKERQSEQKNREELPLTPKSYSNHHCKSRRSEGNEDLSKEVEEKQLDVGSKQALPTTPKKSTKHAQEKRKKGKDDTITLNCSPNQEKDKQPENAHSSKTPENDVEAIDNALPPVIIEVSAESSALIKPSKGTKSKRDNEKQLEEGEAKSQESPKRIRTTITRREDSNPLRTSKKANPTTKRATIRNSIKPLSFSPDSAYLTQSQELLSYQSKLLRPRDQTNYLLKKSFVDGRGAWEIYFFLASAIFEKTRKAIRKKNMEKIEQHFSQVKDLVELMGTAVDAIFKDFTESEVVSLADSNMVGPFWYKYGKGLATLKFGMERVKAASLSVTKNEDSQAFLNREYPPLWGIVFHQTKDAVMFKAYQDIKFIQYHRNANVNSLKTFFSLPDHPLCVSFIGASQLPAIKKSKTYKIPRDSSQEKPNKKIPVILHIHGGGFVAGTPQFHETYLRDWAIKTRALIISVDYSLSPESKFPIALEECYYIYRWIKSPDNGLYFDISKIVFAGDSAGGNLVIATCLRAITDNFPVPDGIFAAYPVLNLTKSITSSPSRTIFVHDVFVPIHFMLLALESYVPAGVDSTNWLCSPLFAPKKVLKKLPQLVLFSAGYDPLLDDTTNFIRRLEKLGIPFRHKLYRLPHGFLNYALPLIPAAMRAKSDSIAVLNEMLGQSSDEPSLTLAPDATSALDTIQ